MAYLSGIIILTFFRRHDHMKISTYVECSTLEFVCGSVETFGCHDEVFVVLVVVGCSCKNVQPAVQQTKPNTSIFYWVFACFSYLQPTHNQPHVCEKYGQVLFTEQTEKPPAAGNWVWGEMGKMLVLHFGSLLLSRWPTKLSNTFFFKLNAKQHFPVLISKLFMWL